MKNLLVRSISGVTFAAVVFAGILIHPLIFALIFASFSTLALFEFYSLLEKTGFKPYRYSGIAVGILIFVLFFLVADKIVSQNMIIVLILFPFVPFLTELFNKNEQGFENSLITLAGIMYVSVPFGILNFIVLPGSNSDLAFYPWIMAGILFIIWVYDSVAYFTGSLIGKHKIYSRISPGKSWEGLIGGAVFAVIMGIINAVLFPSLSMTRWIVIGIIVVAFGTCGDFFESKLKRVAGVKDSGNLMPGHGGILDRFDSLLFSVPVIFIWLNLFGNI